MDGMGIQKKTHHPIHVEFISHGIHVRIYNLRSHAHGPPGRYQGPESPTVSVSEFLSWVKGEVWGPIFPGYEGKIIRKIKEGH